MEQELRKKILERLEDLKRKIETNEPFPEGEQNLETLIETDDRLEEILSAWYY